LQVRICVSVMERTMQGTIRVLRELERHNPDLFEIRFDMMQNTSSIAKIRQVTDLPLIATNRRSGEGGFFHGTEEARMETLANATQDGFDYVDVELNTKNIARFVRRFKQEGARVIVSYHNKKNTPRLPALESTLKSERDADADVCKVVTTAKSYADNLRCLAFLNKHARKTRLVCFAMGRLGMPSRILSPLFGAYFTFASSGVGKETAVGQIPVSSLKDFYNEFAIT
jgi:3-dehydroquinate dehydratase-1